MPKRSLMDDPAHWHRRAAEARRLADQLKDDPVAHETMLDVAESYERLAVLAEAKQSSKPRS
jgi:hypothetical protein